jgi:hypothetical protein
MSFPGSLQKLGYKHRQHHNEQWELEIRDVGYSARVIDRDEYGNTVYEEDSVGDDLCHVLWKRDNRPMSGWASVWPATMQDDSEAYPVRNDDWDADSRFMRLPVSSPKAGGESLWPKFPKGTYGLVTGATEEYEQHNLFFPADPRLVAVHFAGDFEMGSLVYDLNDADEYDPDRKARLQTLTRVVKKPLGQNNALSWHLNITGRGDAMGGWVTDLPNGGTKTSVKSSPQSKINKANDGDGVDSTVVGGPDAGTQSLVVGRVSVHYGGFIDIGDGGCGHVLGEDGDGNKILSAHISTSALFRKNNTEDGELAFEIYEKPDSDPDHTVPVLLGWAGDKWRWVAKSHFYIPEDD